LGVREGVKPGEAEKETRKEAKQVKAQQCAVRFLL